MRTANFSHHISLVILGSLLLFISSCKPDDDNNTEPVREPLMTVNFTNDFIPPEFEAIIFISDMHGNLVADTNFSGNGTCEILPKTGQIIPGQFMVTVVKYDLYWHNLMIYINTYMGISSSEWTIMGDTPDTIGHATVQLSNIPVHSGMILYSSSGYYNYTSATKAQKMLLYLQPDNYYVKFNSDNGKPKYKWLTGIEPGGSYTADLSQMDTPDSAAISLPITAKYFEAWIYGFEDQTYDLPTGFLCDLVFSGITPTNQIVVDYPPDKFVGFRSKIIIRESFQSSIEWTNNIIGNIPSNFIITDAEIVSYESNGPEMHVQTAGNYDVIQTKWHYMSKNNEIFEWSVFGADTLTSIKLPEISPKVLATFSSLSLDSLAFNNVELLDFLEMDSYQEMIDATFNPSNPRLIGQLSSKSVMAVTLY